MPLSLFISISLYGSLSHSCSLSTRAVSLSIRLSLSLSLAFQSHFLPSLHHSPCAPTFHTHPLLPAILPALSFSALIPRPDFSLSFPYRSTTGPKHVGAAALFSTRVPDNSRPVVNHLSAIRSSSARGAADAHHMTELEPNATTPPRGDAQIEKNRPHQDSDAASKSTESNRDIGSEKAPAEIKSSTRASGIKKFLLACFSATAAVFISSVYMVRFIPIVDNVARSKPPAEYLCLFCRIDVYTASSVTTTTSRKMRNSSTRSWSKFVMREYCRDA